MRELGETMEASPALLWGSVLAAAGWFWCVCVSASWQPQPSSRTVSSKGVSELPAGAALATWANLCVCQQQHQGEGRTGTQSELCWIGSLALHLGAKCWSLLWSPLKCIFCWEDGSALPPAGCLWPVVERVLKFLIFTVCFGS